MYHLRRGREMNQIVILVHTWRILNRYAGAVNTLSCGRVENLIYEN